MKQITYKEGIGELLAKGEKAFIEIKGGDTYKYADHIKGVESAYDLRNGLIVENFGQLTNPRGGHHARGYSITYMPRKAESIRRYCLEYWKSELFFIYYSKPTQSYSLSK